jgi:(5-formylfuran-3-yl)methyl phosphate transaminase
MRPFIVMKLLARANELEALGHSVIHMEVGEPDLPPPELCRAAGVAAIEEHRGRYTASMGLPELRRAIADYYQDEYGVGVDPGRVVVTTGTSAAFLLVMGGWFPRGARVAVTDPGYPCYPNFAEFLGLDVVRVPVAPERGFRPRSEDLDQALAAGPVDGMILTSPSNPTGAMLTREDYRLVEARVPRIISDEIYHGIIVDDDAEIFTGAELGEHVTVIDGFSKKWSMTGGRLGWCVIPTDLVPHMEMLTQNLYICPPTVAQHAGLAAITEGRAAVRERRALYRARLDALIPALEALGLTVPFRPQGAFYLYVDVSRFTDDSYAFCFDLLERAHVAITPGADFGEHHAARYVRFSLANSKENILEGVRRIGEHLAAG